MLKVFIGYDYRQPISYTIAQHSLFTRSTKPVSITPLVLEQLPLERQGLTPFTFSRFLVPYLCDYKGFALFVDIDVLFTGDVAKLFELADSNYAVQVVKNEKRFEWASVMLFNCEKCTILTPEYIEEAKELHTLKWAKEEEIGALPSEWNHLVGYDEKRRDAKLVHFTQGVPCHDETHLSEYSNEWHKVQQQTISSYPWATLMGDSVHATNYNGRRVPHLYAKENSK